MEMIKIDSEMLMILEERVAYLAAHGNEKYDRMNKQMVANDMGISYTTLRKILNKTTKIVSLKTYNSIQNWIDDK